MFDRLCAKLEAELDPFKALEPQSGGYAVLFIDPGDFCCISVSWSETEDDAWMVLLSADKDAWREERSELISEAFTDDQVIAFVRDHSCSLHEGSTS